MRTNSFHLVAQKCVMALRIDQVTLLIHHIIILNQTFTDTEVVFLHFLLRTLDGVGNHVMLDHLAFLEAHTIHDACDSFRTKHTHQIILQRDIEYRTSRVTLTAGTTA